MKVSGAMPATQKVLSICDVLIPSVLAGPPWGLTGSSTIPSKSVFCNYVPTLFSLCYLKAFKKPSIKKVPRPNGKHFIRN
jgi:hypothetical protein